MSIHGAVDAVVEGFWLGVLDREALHRLDEHCYDRWSMYHGEQHNLSGLNDWEEAVIEEHFAGRRRLLLVGAGGGREVIALARRGFCVRGFECHPDLVALARRLIESEGIDARVDLLARDAAPPPCPDVDGIIVGWGAYMLIEGRRARVAFLEALRPQLTEGCPLLLSFFHRPPWRRLKVSLGVANACRRVLSRPPRQLGDRLEPNFVHRFTQEEITGELRDAGFDLLHYSSAEYGHAVAVASG